MQHTDETSIGDACDAHACAVPQSRRRFLRDAFLSAAGAMVAVGMSRTAAFAMPLEITEPRAAKGTMRSYTIPAADGAQIDRSNDVILVRWQNALYAFALSCPHQNTALRWNDGDHAFQCPKHHSKFMPDGTYIEDSGRATRNMDRFAIARDASGVSVDLDRLYEADNDGAQWAAAVVRLA